MESAKKRKVTTEMKKSKATGKSSDEKFAKRPLSAFFFFSQHLRDEMKKKGEASNGVQGLAKMAGEKWKELDDQGKKPFVEQAEKDKQRYEKEIASGLAPVPRKTKESKKSKESKEKDPNRPKRATSAYLYYVADFRKSGEAVNVKHTDIMKLAAAKWKSLNESEKKKFEDMEKKDRERFNKEMSAYNAKGGSKKPISKASKKNKTPAKKNVASSNSSKESEDEDDIIQSGDEESFDEDDE